MSTPGEQDVDPLRSHGDVSCGEDLAQLKGGLAEVVQPGRGDLDGLRFAVRPQHLDDRGALVGAAGRWPAARPGQQDGEDVGRSLCGIVHAAPEQRRLTGHAG
jgi:hypothetical protein